MKTFVYRMMIIATSSNTKIGNATLFIEKELKCKMIVFRILPTSCELIS